MIEREPERAEYYLELERNEEARRADRKEQLREELRKQPSSGRLTVSESLGALDEVRSKGRNRWTARCPVHEDRVSSLGVREHPDIPDVPQFHCSAGCTFMDIRAAIRARL